MNVASEEVVCGDRRRGIGGGDRRRQSIPGEGAREAEEVKSGKVTREGNTKFR